MTRTRSRSLTWRLTLLFALTSALVLFLLGVLIGRSVEQHFVEQDVEILDGRMLVAREVLERATGPLPDDALARRLGDAFAGYAGLSVAIADGQGRVLYASDRTAFPAIPWDAETIGARGAPFKWVADDGTVRRAIVARATSGADRRHEYTVAIALDIAHHEHFMSAFRRTLWAFIALATMAMGLLGWFSVRRGLSPLQAIRRQAAEITANRLHSRLPAGAIPVELADLAGELNDMLSRLEESFERLSNFSSDLAHELRTPLSNLLTQTQVTLSRARSADEYREVLLSNAEEFERLSRMISDMLFLARTDHAQAIAHAEPVDLRAEAGDLLEYFAIVAEEKRLCLSLTGRGTASGDRLMLRRALGNLLSNAIRHAQVGGVVAVNIGSGALGQIEVSVANSGTAIPAEHLPRLFDRFYRVDSARHRTSEGSGLGLAIARSIVRAHGGQISASSDDRLTRFTVSLPEACHCGA